MSSMRFKRLEHHSVTSEYIYDLPEQHIIETFGSLKRFEEIISHRNEGGWPNTPAEGEPTNEEEDTLFWEFFDNYDYDREDDWWSERKGGYEVTYEIPDKKN